MVSADPDEGVRFFVKHVLSVRRNVDIPTWRTVKKKKEGEEATDRIRH